MWSDVSAHFVSGQLDGSSGARIEDGDVANIQIEGGSGGSGGRTTETMNIPVSPDMLNHPLYQELMGSLGKAPQKKETKQGKKGRKKG